MEKIQLAAASSGGLKSLDLSGNNIGRACRKITKAAAAAAATKTKTNADANANDDCSTARLQVASAEVGKRRWTVDVSPVCELAKAISSCDRLTALHMSNNALCGQTCFGCA